MPAGCSWYLGSEVLGCRTLRLESQSSAGHRMQPYPPSPGHVWPGHLHSTGCLSVWATDTGFPTVLWRACLVFWARPPLASPGLGFRFGTCWGSGVRLPSSSPSRGLRCVRVYAGSACFAPVLVGVWCAFVWARAARLVVGMRAGALLPSRLSRLGVAVRGQVRVGTQLPLSWLRSRVARLGRGLVRTPRFFLWWCGRWSWLGFP